MPHPRNHQHLVKDGDTLAKIAETQYRDASLWPHIARANSLPASGAVLVGMKLRMPVIPPAPPFVRTTTLMRPLPDPPPAKPVAYPRLRYKFSAETKEIQLSNILKVKLSVDGSIVIQKSGTLASAYIEANDGPEITREYHAQFQNLAADFNVKYDFKGGRPVAGLTGTLAANLPEVGAISTTGSTFTFSSPDKHVSGLFDKNQWGFEGQLGYEIVFSLNPPAPQLPKVAAPSLTPQEGWLASLLGALLAGLKIIIIDDPVVVASISYPQAARLMNWPPLRV